MKNKRVGLFLGILFLINTIESSITIANKGKIIKAGNSGTVGVGEGCYCDDKAISHFREIAKTGQEEGLELIENLQQPDDFSDEGINCCVIEDGQ